MLKIGFADLFFNHSGVRSGRGRACMRTWARTGGRTRQRRTATQARLRRAGIFIRRVKMTAPTLYTFWGVCTEDHLLLYFRDSWPASLVRNRFFL